MRLIGLVLFLAMFGFVAQAQDTATPTPTETATLTPTPTPEPWAFATVIPLGGAEEDGQIIRYDYTYTLGDVVVWFLMTLLLLSVWGMFIYVVIDGSRK